MAGFGIRARCLIFILWAVSLFAQTPLDDLLQLDLTDLTLIKVTTPIKIQRRVDSVPAKVAVITREEMIRRGCISLEDALSHLPGFQFRDIMGMNSYIFLRGIPNQNNLIQVLIDGVQINELNSGGFYGGSHYNLQNVERIEVVYGPASAVYGTNAVSGIVNIITRSPKEHRGWDAQVLGGTFATGSAAASYGFFDEKNKWGLRLSGRVFTSEKANLKGAAGDGNWTDDLDNFDHAWSADAQLIYKNLKYSLVFQNKRIASATFNKAVQTPFQDNDTFWNIRFVNHVLTGRFSLSASSRLSGRVYVRDATVLGNSVLFVDSVQHGY